MRESLPKLTVAGVSLLPSAPDDLNRDAPGKRTADGMSLSSTGQPLSARPNYRPLTKKVGPIGLRISRRLDDCNWRFFNAVYDLPTGGSFQSELPPMLQGQGLAGVFPGPLSLPEIPRPAEPLTARNRRPVPPLERATVSLHHHRYNFHRFQKRVLPNPAPTMESRFVEVGKTEKASPTSEMLISEVKDGKRPTPTGEGDKPQATEAADVGPAALSEAAVLESLSQVATLRRDQREPSEPLLLLERPRQSVDVLQIEGPPVSLCEESTRLLPAFEAVQQEEEEGKPTESSVMLSPRRAIRFDTSPHCRHSPRDVAAVFHPSGTGAPRLVKKESMNARFIAELATRHQHQLDKMLEGSQLSSPHNVVSPRSQKGSEASPKKGRGSPMGSSMLGKAVAQHFTSAGRAVLEEIQHLETQCAEALFACVPMRKDEAHPHDERRDLLAMATLRNMFQAMHPMDQLQLAQSVPDVMYNDVVISNAVVGGADVPVPVILEHHQHILGAPDKTSAPHPHNTKRSAPHPPDPIASVALPPIRGLTFRRIVNAPTLNEEDAVWHAQSQVPLSVSARNGVPDDLPGKKLAGAASPRSVRLAWLRQQQREAEKHFGIFSLRKN